MGKKEHGNNGIRYDGPPDRSEEKRVGIPCGYPLFSSSVLRISVGFSSFRTESYMQPDPPEQTILICCAIRNGKDAAVPYSVQPAGCPDDLAVESELIFLNQWLLNRLMISAR